MPRKPINREPLGIRKLDVQADRKAFRKVAREDAARTAEYVAGWCPGPDGRISLTEVELARFLQGAMERAWDTGVHTGAKATRERVSEALSTGRLSKREWAS